MLSLLFILLFLSGHSLFAQANAAGSTAAPGAVSVAAPASASASRRGDALTFKIAIMGPGNEPYFWFGHIGLVIEDRSGGRSRFYDWGVFSFESERFFINFAFGNMLYCCMVSRADLNYNSYISHNRNITLYTLDLPAESKEAVLRYVDNNVLPENRDYYYHIFKDNCATRIRDIIDMALNGQFKAAFGEAPGRFTIRQHADRHTWHNEPVNWLTNFWMGQNIDRPVTVWDEMFLPSEIAMRIKDFRYKDAAGKERALVSGVEVLYNSSTRPPVLDSPGNQWYKKLIVSLLFSALILLLFRFTGRKRGFHLFIALLQSVSGLVFGLIGSALFFMSFFTNHDYTYNNSNIFYVNPLFLALVPMGLILAFSKDKKKLFVITRLIRLFWTYVILGALLTMVIKLSPAFYQQNQSALALILPLALTMVVVFFMMGRPGFQAGARETTARPGGARETHTRQLGAQSKLNKRADKKTGLPCSALCKGLYSLL